MQRDSLLRRWLKLPFLYNLLRDAVGATALRRRVIQNHVRAKAGDKVVNMRAVRRESCAGFQMCDISGSTSIPTILPVPGARTATRARLSLATQSPFEMTCDLKMPIL